MTGAVEAGYIGLWKTRSLLRTGLVLPFLEQKNSCLGALLSLLEPALSPPLGKGS